MLHIYHLVLMFLWPVSSCFDPSSPANQLPTDLKPQQYRLYLAFDINDDRDFPYIGLIKIYLKVIHSTDKIVIHAQGYKVEDDKVTLEGQSAPSITSVTHDTNLTSFMTIRLDQQLVPGAMYTLSVPFYGYLNRNTDGLYVSSYDDAVSHDNEYIIATKFKPSSARKAFPCFDEPTYKASLYLNLCYTREYTAISNTPPEKYKAKHLHIDNSETTDLLHLNSSIYSCTKFQNSVPMSSYLYTFVIFKEYYINFLRNKTPFRIWVRSQAVKQTEYATNTAAQLHNYFSDFFNMTLKHQHDIVALPEFVDSCLETWGLVTCSEANILNDKNAASPFEEKINIAIAHALVHQWLGNLVTVKRWSDLWLFEALASYIASMGTAVVESLDVRETDAIVFDTLIQDSVQALSPFVVEGLMNVSYICDLNVHNMGIWLLRMLHLTLGQKVFIGAVHNFITKYSYSNADQDDFWRELTLVGHHSAALNQNVTVKSVMDTWTTQTGYPLLTVRRDYDNRTLIITQQPFQSLTEAHPWNHTWCVPISTLAQGEYATRPTHWMYQPSDLVVREYTGAEQWILVNPDMLAPYRVNYDERNWKLLIKTLNGPDFDKIPILSRVQLISDSFALVWRDQLDYKIVIELIRYLKHETHHLPLLTAMTALNKIDSVLRRSPHYGTFQKFVQRLIRPAYKLRVTNKTHVEKTSVKMMIAEAACYLKVPRCEETSEDLFRKWMNDPNPGANNPIPSEQRAVVCCVAARRGSANEWRFLMKRRMESRNMHERQILLRAMTCTRDVWLLKMFLEWSITEDSEVRRQEAVLVISSVMRSQVGYYVAKEFLMERISDIHRVLSGQYWEGVGEIVKAMLEQFTTDKEMEEFLKWKSANADYLMEVDLSLQQGLQEARLNIAWVKNHMSRLIGLIS